MPEATCVLGEAFLEERPLAVALQAAPLPAILPAAVASDKDAHAALARHPAALVVGAVQEGVPPLTCAARLWPQDVSALMQHLVTTFQSVAAE